MKIEIDSLVKSVPDGMPITLPAGEPTSKPVLYTSWEKNLGSAVTDGLPSLTGQALGNLRIEVLQRLAALPDSDELPDR